MKVIQDGTVYKTHNEVLAAILGVCRTANHREAIYGLSDKWMFWFPNMVRQSGDWVNRYCDGENVIEQVYVGTGDDGRMERDMQLGCMRITFAYENGGYVFKGVYGEGRQIDARTACFRKLSNACEIVFSGSLI